MVRLKGQDATEVVNLSMSEPICCKATVYQNDNVHPHMHVSGERR